MVYMLKKMKEKVVFLKTMWYTFSNLGFLSDIKEKEIRNKIHESLFFFGKIGQNTYNYSNSDIYMNNYSLRYSSWTKESKG